MISIIIPLYNREATVGRAIDSIIKYCENEFELIVVDDGSTDNGVSFIESQYSTMVNSGKLVVIQQDNSGAGSARNVGLKRAKGAYVMFVDSDDEMIRPLSFNEQQDVDLAVYTELNFKQKLNKEEIINGVLGIYGEPIFDSGPVSKVFSRNVLIKNDIKFPDLYIGEDLVFNLIMVFHCSKICFHFNNGIYKVHELTKSITTSLDGFQESTNKICLIESVKEIVFNNLESKSSKQIVDNFIVKNLWMHLSKMTKIGNTDAKNAFDHFCEYLQKNSSIGIVHNNLNLGNVTLLKSFMLYLILNNSIIRSGIFHIISYMRRQKDKTEERTRVI